MSQKIVFSSAIVTTRGTLERPLPTVSSEVQAKPELAVESLATGNSHVIVILLLLPQVLHRLQNKEKPMHNKFYSPVRVTQNDFRVQHCKV